MRAWTIATIGAIWLLLAGSANAQVLGAPPVQQTSAPEAPERLEFGNAYLVSTKPPLRFTLERASYALGWTQHYQAASAVADASQKMLVLNFTVENTGDRDLEFREGTLKYQAIDEQGMAHERPSTMHVRAAGSTTAAEGGTQRAERTILKPGVRLPLYTAILVPKELRIPRLIVSLAQPRATELSFDLGGKIAPLPPAFQRQHPELVRDEIEAGPGQFLAGTSLDVRVDRTTTSTDPALVGRRLRAGTQWVVVAMTVRNRSASVQNISAGNFRESRLVDAVDVRHAPILTLHPERPGEWRPVVDPGRTESFRLIFQVPEGSSPSRLRLQVIGNEGRRSHHYVVPLAGGPLLAPAGPPVAAGVYFPGRYALLADAPLTGVGIVTTAPAPAPGAIEPSSAPAEQPAPMPTLRRAAFSLDSIRKPRGPRESSGDEPYVIAWRFGGTLRPGGAPVVVLDAHIATLGPNDWLKVGGVDYRPTGSQYAATFPVESYNVKPYEFYGIAIAALEADGSSHTERQRFARQFAQAMAARFQAIVESAPAVDVNDARAATQEAYLRRLVTAMKPLRDAVNVQGIYDSVFGTFGDADDFLGHRLTVGVHLPSVSSSRWAEITAGGGGIVRRPGVGDLDFRETDPALLSAGQFYSFSFRQVAEP
jgi:hypothetical protein